MKSLMLVLSVLLFFWTALLYVRVKAPFGFAILMPRLFAGALSPILTLVGAGGALLAWGVGAPTAACISALASVTALVAAGRIVSRKGDFVGAFGPDWDRSIPADRRAGMLRSRWLWKTSTPPQAIWQRDIPFWTIPDTGRTLICDMWQPPAGVKSSGLGYIYFHGSAWYILDKDAFTRRFFRHLTGQGHVVMDVAYRLYPETDVPGMIGDAKRAIVWLKAHAAEYGISPDHIVIGGSSAGGHMAQLAGFAPDHPALTPDDVQGLDLTVRGIISCYGPSDMSACFRHTNQHKIRGVGASPPDMQLLNGPPPARMMKLFGEGAARMGFQKMAVAGRLDWLIGGTPEQVPERYSLYSPVNHVHAGCPPTLLIQGEDDLITSVQATRELYRRLRSKGVPAINVIFPHTDHGFDLVLMAGSPSAQGALFDIERFLAVLTGEQLAAQPQAAAM